MIVCIHHVIGFFIIGIDIPIINYYNLRSLSLSLMFFFIEHFSPSVIIRCVDLHCSYVIYIYTLEHLSLNTAHPFFMLQNNSFRAFSPVFPYLCAMFFFAVLCLTDHAPKHISMTKNKQINQSIWLTLVQQVSLGPGFHHTLLLWLLLLLLFNYY